MPPSIAHFLAHAQRYAETVEPAIRFLQRRDPTWRCASSGARSCRKVRDLLRCRAARSTWPRRSARSAPPSRRATSRASTWMTWPMYGATASIRASNWRATASSSRPARPVRSAARGARRRAHARRRSARRASRASCSPRTQPDVVAITAPFPGNVYGAFRMARAIRAAAPEHEAGARRRLGEHRAARACASRACSTTSTT